MIDFKNKKVLVWGLGLNDGGVGMVDFLVSAGAKVKVTDGKTVDRLKPSLDKLSKYGDKVSYTLGKHIAEDFLWADVIIRNPAIKPSNKWIEFVKSHDKKILMEMALFHKLAPCPIIGITGTRGKSTTTSLIYEFMKQKLGENQILLGGNIGKSAVRELPGLGRDDYAILELSSFQLEGMGEAKVSPHVAVMTNIYKDHLNWHKDMEDYIDTKRNILKFQVENDYAVMNLDNSVTLSLVDKVKSQLITFSLKDKKATFYTDPKEKLVYQEGKEVLDISSSKLEGEHNLYNITAAIAATSMYDISKDNITKVLGTFSGVPGREELVGELKGIKYINDTCATSVEAMKVALQRFGEDNNRNLVLVSGGVDKGLDYSLLNKLLKKYVKAIVFLEGTASEKMYDEWKDLSDLELYKYYDNMEEAVNKARSLAKSGDYVILCPGGSSFNMFENEFQRGDKFIEAVEKLGN